MLRKLLCRRYFCFDWSTSNPSKILMMVKTQMKANRNYVKDNGVYVLHHIADMIDRQQWSDTLRFLNQINTSVIDKWELWTHLSSNITRKISTISRMNQQQLSSLLLILFKIKYQLSAQDGLPIYQIAKGIISTNDLNKIVRLFKNLAVSYSELFVHLRQKIQAQIINSIEKAGSINQENQIAISHGIQSGFWTRQFMDKIQNYIRKNENTMNKNVLFRLSKFMQLPNLDYKTQIAKAVQFSKSATQLKIGEMLKDLGYVFQQNMLINKLEVDFILGSNIIMQYNGIRHYRINNSKVGPINQTTYEKWKKKMLRLRGFLVLDIPFYQWQKLQNEKVQKLYLVQKIQKTILQKMKSKNKAREAKTTNSPYGTQVV